jgi:hypothetical protein
MALNLLSLRAVLGIDTSEYDAGLDRAGKKASVFGDMLKANLVSKGIEVAAKGMLKLGKAAVSMVEQSVASYADYEQLVGGVETLFKGSAKKVQQYAQDAYINAGLSANEYMETVTSFSASLIQSLRGDTEQAAELANVAIQDMSDNANKMGSDMASLQNAYAGFAKQNYTMLDNLKLGYGGTKSEMDRLIKDAMKLDKTFRVATKTTGKGKKANVELAYSYADIVKAIHIVQTEMQITGTTQKEAEKTISGSMNRLKAAWKNFITAMGEGNEDKLDMLIDQLVDSAEVAMENLLPVIEKAIYGVVHLIEALAPIIADKLPGLLERILPSLTKATATLVTAFAKALIANMPIIIDAAKQILSAVISEISKEAPWLIPVLGGIGGAKVATKGYGLLKTLGVVGGGAAARGAAGAAAAGGAASGGAATGGAVASGAAAAGISGITVAATAAAGSIVALGAIYAEFDGKFKELSKNEQVEAEKAADTYQKLYETKGKKIADEWARMAYGIQTRGLSVVQAQQALTYKVKEYWKDTPKSSWDALTAEWNKYFGANGKGFIGLLDDAIAKPLSRFVQNGIGWGRDLVSNFIGGINNMWESAKRTVSNFAQMIRNFLGFSEPKEGPLSNFHTYAPDMMKLFAKGIDDNASLVRDAASNAFDLNGGMVNGNKIIVPKGGVGANDSSRMLTAIFQMNGMEVGRILTPLIEAEQQRIGVRLVGGNA